MMPTYSGICLYPLPSKEKKNVVKVGPPLANFSGSAHVPNSVPALTCTYFIIDHMQFVYLLNL